MKWLLDANLSYRLVKQLADLPIAVVHVSRIGLPVPANDREIRDLACTREASEQAQEQAVVWITSQDAHNCLNHYGHPLYNS
jgi:predicted nuclease of predicted toxin-antitoxin system